MHNQNNTTIREQIAELARERYSAEEEHLWARSPSDAILRRRDNGKWFAVLMTVSRARLGLDGEGSVGVMNVKCDELLIGSLLANDFVLPAYHMNKRKWISVLLDGSADMSFIGNCLQMSYELTAPRPKVKKDKNAQKSP